MTFTLDIETLFKVTADRLTKGTWKRIYDPEMGFSYNSAMSSGQEISDDQTDKRTDLIALINWP